LTWTPLLSTLVLHHCVPSGWPPYTQAAHDTYVTPLKVKGKMQGLPVSGPDTVRQVPLLLQVLVVHTWTPTELQTQVLQSTVVREPGVQREAWVVVVVVVVVVVTVVVVVGAAVVVLVVVHTKLLQTGCPSDPHTQVLQSCVKEVPGVQEAGAVQLAGQSAS